MIHVQELVAGLWTDESCKVLGAFAYPHLYNSHFFFLAP